MVVDHGLWTTLVLGAYGAYAFVVGAYLDLRARIDRVVKNHVAHLEERVARLERLEDERR